MAEYIKDTYHSVRDAALSGADRLGAGKLARIVAGAPDILYTLTMLLRDGRVSKRSKFKLGIAAAYFALPLDNGLGALDDIYVALVALAEVMDDVGEAALCEYWPGEAADLMRFKALMDSFNEKAGAGAIRRLGRKLGIGVEVSFS